MKKIVFAFLLLAISSGALLAQGHLGAALPSKDFLLGKTHFEKDTNFVLIDYKYTVLRKPNNYIQKQTYQAFLKMREAAMADGVRLTVTSASRNFWVQRYIWEQKWNKSALPEEQRAANILKYNSMCGTSRHHWGTDMDFNSPKLEYWNTAEGKKVYAWLCENAHKFGFYQPYTAKGEPGSGMRSTGYNEEKWHWSYYPLANVYMEHYKELIKDEDLNQFLGAEYVKLLDVIGNYVFGVAAPPEA